MCRSARTSLIWPLFCGVAMFVLSLGVMPARASMWRVSLSCRSGKHDRCDGYADLSNWCTCWCHVDDLDALDYDDAGL